jgi:16S rRNA (guanine527-N7)-methyltransferase
MIERLAQVAGRPVSRETFERLECYVALLQEESARQNLVSATSLAHVWDRHILDSAQLVRFEPLPQSSWIDIGSGAGLPGIVVASLVEGPVTLVEPRRLRADFLHRACESLKLNAIVRCERVERTSGTFDVLTARAVTELSALIEISQHLSTRKTTWVLPKGRNAAAELSRAQQTWQGAFHVEQSATDADSRIIVGTDVRKRP